jgi:hypothetical protein
MPTSLLPPAKRRGYSKAFPSDPATAKRYLLDTIPGPLWIAARRRAKREQRSMRAVILQLLTDYIDGREQS